MAVNIRHRAGHLQDSFQYRCYFAAAGKTTMYPEVQIEFETVDDRLHHIPLLIEPFNYTTYRDRD